MLACICPIEGARPLHNTQQRLHYGDRNTIKREGEKNVITIYNPLLNRPECGSFCHELNYFYICAVKSEQRDGMKLIVRNLSSSDFTTFTTCHMGITICAPSAQTQSPRVSRRGFFCRVYFYEQYRGIPSFIFFL